MIDDNLHNVQGGFFKERRAGLRGRFPSWLRAVVTETNDPLRMHRVRFKCPELHDWDMKVEEQQWALPHPAIGGRGSGEWNSPMIDDTIFVCFEKDHPYAPLYVSAADATRRQSYTLESVYGKTPLPVKEKADPNKQFEKAERPDDYDEKYLPEDERPMSHGKRDRYGSIHIMSSVGFFPQSHDVEPAPAGQDAVSGGKFEASKEKPKVNDPDLKFVASLTKYGNMMMLADIGYKWKEEFEGDFDEDNEFEIDRVKYYQELFTEKSALNEGGGESARDRDQRRLMLLTRYGHKLEFRDVGFNKSRPKEFKDESIDIGFGEEDERWIKVRTKGGMLFQMWDKGNTVDEDVFVQRLLKDEYGGEIDREKEGVGWKDDARQLRWVSRHGFKMVLDDRGSHKTTAYASETPHGNGWLVKGRRDNKGFGIEFNEKDALNHLMAYTPKSKVFELNDKEDFIMLCTDTAGPISEPWLGLDDNEFATKNAMVEDPEKDTFHLKLDKKNKYLRLKTPQLQGIEARDDGNPARTWVEARDVDDRGLWMCKQEEWTVLRSRLEKTIFMMILDNASNKLLIQNDEANGLVQIYCENDVEVIGKKNVILNGRNIHLRAENQVILQGGGRQFVVGPGQVGSAGPIDASRFNGFFPRTMPGPGANSPSPVPGTARKANPDKRSRKPLSPLPFDQSRGKCNNKPQKQVGKEVIRK